MNTYFIENSDGYDFLLILDQVPPSVLIKRDGEPIAEAYISNSYPFKSYAPKHELDAVLLHVLDNQERYMEIWDDVAPLSYYEAEELGHREEERQRQEEQDRLEWEAIESENYDFDYGDWIY